MLTILRCPAYWWITIFIARVVPETCFAAEPMCMSTVVLPSATSNATEADGCGG